MREYDKNVSQISVKANEDEEGKYNYKCSNEFKMNIDKHNGRFVDDKEEDILFNIGVCLRIKNIIRYLLKSHDNYSLIYESNS